MTTADKIVAALAVIRLVLEIGAAVATVWFFLCVAVVGHVHREAERRYLLAHQKAEQPPTKPSSRGPVIGDLGEGPPCLN